MANKRAKPGEIVTKLRQVEVLVGQGMPRADAIRQIGVTEQSGPVTVSCRPECSFRPLSVRRRPGFSSPVLSAFDAVLYMAATGCQWRMLPKDFPPISTVQRYFYDWRDSGLWGGLWQTIRFHLSMATRELEGREAQPTAGVIDSQSVKSTESGGVSGYDAGKKD